MKSDFSKNIVIAISLLFMPVCGVMEAAPVVVNSPDGTVRAVISTNHGLSYSLTRLDRPVIDSSRLGITIDGVDLGQNVTATAPKRRTLNETYPCRGVHAVARNHFNEAAIPLRSKTNGTQYVLAVRVFNDGFAFRYIVPGDKKRTVSGEATSFRIPANSSVWFQTNTTSYEGRHQKAAVETVKPATYIGPPMTIELPGDEGFAAVTEAALFDYSGMTLCSGDSGSRIFRAAFQDDESWQLATTIKTPWRVVMTTTDLNGLVNCDIVGNLCDAPSPQLASAKWIKPGRSLWHWWSGKLGNFDTVAFDKQKWWVDKAAQLGFENYLVDAGWEHTWGTPQKDKWALLKELVDYAKKKGVGITVWKRWKTGKTEGIEMVGLGDPQARRSFFDKCAKIGVASIKIDFMNSESKDRIDFYTDVLKDAADYKLMINFHGANKPTGESRTFPNEITREGVKGLEYNKWSKLTPDHYASLPFTRYLAGHGDFTPCTFNPKMLKGTTFALQLASAVVFTSPMLHWADRPELYLNSPAVDVIKAIPSTWDETVVLEGSEIGSLAAFARRRGDKWFVGVINGRGKRSYDFKLSFLGKGAWDAVMLADSLDRPDKLVRSENKLTAMDKIKINLHQGGGFVAMLTPEQ